jgi:phosphopantothenoylcysteine synthetase/decarboxylase
LIQKMKPGKNIVLGVTGSIAAHKAVDIASTLTKQGCEVNVVLTKNALHFITPLSFKTLSRHPVVTDLYDEEEGWKPAHIHLADEADLFLIAPATANVLAKLVHGFADDAFDLHRPGLEARGQGFDRPSHERQNVAAPGHPGKCGHPQSAWRRVYRSG